MTVIITSAISLPRKEEEGMQNPADSIFRKTAGGAIVPRFGSTDCRSGCGGRLKFIGHKELSDMEKE